MLPLTVCAGKRSNKVTHPLRGVNSNPYWHVPTSSHIFPRVLMEDADYRFFRQAPCGHR